MNKLTYIFSFFILLVLATACDEDQFTNVVEIDIPEHTPLPAVSASFNNQDTSIQVFVSKSQAITGNAEFEVVKDADVRIFKNGTLWQEPTFVDTLNKYSTANLPAIGNDNATYRLEVDVPGFETVSASQIMPSSVSISDLNVVENGTINSFGERSHEITLNITDTGNEKNYYAIEIIYIGTDFEGNPDIYDLYFDSSDPLIEYGYKYMLLDDATFDGQTYNLNAAAEAWTIESFEPGDIVMVRIYNLTKDDFLYNRTYSLYQDADGNPFAEPVVVHQNVENGYGIFSLGAVTEATFEF